MMAEHKRDPRDKSADDAPTAMRHSGAVMTVDRDRLRAALELLATGERGDDPDTLLGFLQLMMLRGSSSPSGYEGWLDGSLVVFLRPHEPSGLSVHVAADNGKRHEEVFAVPFARLAFAELCAAIEGDPSLVGPAFVHVDEAELSILVVTYVEEDEQRAFLDYDEPERTVTDLDAARRARAAVPPPPPSPEELELSGYDPDATLIASPSSELLQLSRRRGGEPAHLFARRRG